MRLLLLATSKGCCRNDSGIVVLDEHGAPCRLCLREEGGRKQVGLPSENGLVVPASPQIPSKTRLVDCMGKRLSRTPPYGICP